LDQIAYRFKTRAGQNMSVKIIGRDANFSVYADQRLDARLIAKDKKWSGRLPSGFNGNCEIVVHSSYKITGYCLEILLK
jgi:hypothetical protein